MAHTAVGAPVAAPPFASIAGLVAILFAACGTAADPNAIPDTVGVGTRASFAVAAPQALIGLDAAGTPLGHIARLPPGAIASSPTLDPKGTAIVFTLIQTSAQEGFGSDIYRVNLDGTDLRALIKHEEPSVFYASASFDRATGLLYVHRRAVNLAGMQQAAETRLDDRIERLDVRTGERGTVLTDAAEPALSPDGKTIVFVHMSRGDQDGLWRANADGSAAGPLLRTRDAFVLLQAPRISPNGREVVISSSGHIVTRRGTSGGKLAHLDIPSEIFVAPMDGTSLRSLGKTGDDVVPAWSPDGTRIAFIAVATFTVVSAAGAVTLERRLPFRYGDPLWLRQ
jgi:dipeptidyl aminopeptidase/acylaminoacyl peptidase